MFVNSGFKNPPQAAPLQWRPRLLGSSPTEEADIGNEGCHKKEVGCARPSPHLYRRTTEAVWLLERETNGLLSLCGNATQGSGAPNTSVPTPGGTGCPVKWGEHQYPTRSAGLRQVAPAHLEVANTSWRWRASGQYAGLPPELRTEESMPRFLVGLKEYTKHQIAI